MILVPLRVVERREDGVLCRLGSEPGKEAPVEFLPRECVLNLVIAEGLDLGVATIDPEKAPESVRVVLGLG